MLRHRRGLAAAGTRSLHRLGPAPGCRGDSGKTVTEPRHPCGFGNGDPGPGAPSPGGKGQGDGGGASIPGDEDPGDGGGACLDSSFHGGRASDESK
ncbi:hypothetical protein PVAP13_3KG387027 [Panicum virgatum]|uniref:Uncharacterized protein n=1 Tax=Panicum virgatum TaxID=38727 RepID=A0A8T0UVS0_PANVG|nr:hypothetical protein PVAP13_3KG387027 [Panicum virgatum]